MVETRPRIMVEIFSPVMDNPTHHFHKWVAKNLE